MYRIENVEDISKPDSVLLVEALGFVLFVCALQPFRPISSVSPHHADYKLEYPAAGGAGRRR